MLHKTAALRMLALIGLSALAPTQADAASCHYFNFKTKNMFNNQRCSVATVPVGPNYVQTIEIGARRFKIEILNRQGVWARINLNGKPGMRFEVDRTTFLHTTDDLEETFDITQ